MSRTILRFWYFGVTALAAACVADPVETSSGAVGACVIETPPPRVLTLLLTLSSIRSAADPANLDEARAIQTELIRGAVRFVSPVQNPRILVVRDDNHHMENVDDPMGIGSGLENPTDPRREHARIRDALSLSGEPCVDLIDEPADGLRPADVRGYDVVWFSNPGHPLDDAQTVSTLVVFAELRGGVVIQGDDMAISGAGALTHLTGTDNGHYFCGHSTDNDVADSYRVTLSAEGAARLGVSFREFLHGNDIDTSVPNGEGESIWATATLNGAAGCPTVPVISAWGAPATSAE